MTNTKLLKSKMVAHGDEAYVQCLADLLSISRTTASGKLGGTIPFTQPEIVLVSKKYDLSAEDIKDIFVGDD